MHGKLLLRVLLFFILAFQISCGHDEVAEGGERVVVYHDNGGSGTSTTGAVEVRDRPLFPAGTCRSSEKCITLFGPNLITPVVSNQFSCPEGYQPSPAHCDYHSPDYVGSCWIVNAPGTGNAPAYYINYYNPYFEYSDYLQCPQGSWGQYSVDYL